MKQNQQKYPIIYFHKHYNSSIMAILDFQNKNPNHNLRYFGNNSKRFSPLRQ